MVPSNLQTFFFASAGVAGALVGLLFVTVSVSAARMTSSSAEGQTHRIRARAALTAFTNSLVVSLFALIPGHKIGPTALAAGLAGLVFILASLISLARLLIDRWRHGTRMRTVLRGLASASLEILEGHGSALDVLFLVGLAVVFVVEAAQGWDLLLHPGHAGAVETISVLVVACFLIGISRSWELIGGPTVGFWQQVASLARHEQAGRSDPPQP